MGTDTQPLEFGYGKVIDMPMDWPGWIILTNIRARVFSWFLSGALLLFMKWLSVHMQYILCMVYIYGIRSTRGNGKCCTRMEEFSLLGVVSIKICRLTSIGLPVINMRESHDRLILKMGIRYLRKMLCILRRALKLFCKLRWARPRFVLGYA